MTRSLSGSEVAFSYPSGVLCALSVSWRDAGAVRWAVENLSWAASSPGVKPGSATGYLRHLRQIINISSPDFNFTICESRDYTFPPAKGWSEE